MKNEVTGFKRYLIFHGMDYESHGGFGEFEKDVDSIEEIVEYIKKETFWEWYEIIDTKLRKYYYYTDQDFQFEEKRSVLDGIYQDIKQEKGDVIE